MSKELNKATVEQAGGDERAAFEQWLEQHMSHHISPELDLAKYEDSGEYRYNPAADYWKAWQARAALAKRSEFHQHLKECADEVASWPSYKREALAQPSPDRAVQAHDIPMLIASEHANPDYAMGWNDCRAKLIGAPSPAQAEGAQEVPSPVSQEYDRHLISLLRKGEALPGHQEEAADEIERLRDWNDHLNNTVLPNILNPNFLMLMKGGERLLDLCTKDGKFIGVSLNDMKDVFDWMVTHARIAPDHAALAQPSQAIAAAPTYQFQSREIGESDWAPCDFSWYLYCSKSPEMDTRVVEVTAQPSPAQAEQAEPERPEVVARVVHSNPVVLDQCAPLNANDELMTVAQHAASVARWAEMFNRVEQERDAALARVAELEKQEPVATIAKVPGEDWNGLHFYRDLQGMQPGTKLYAAPVAQAQHSVPAYVSYTTRPAESLAGIALRQLKDESRWVEIRDINAHAFPDMQSHSYYPAGTVIKLPAAAPGKEVGHE